MEPRTTSEEVLTVCVCFSASGPRLLAKIDGARKSALYQKILKVIWPLFSDLGALGLCSKNFFH